MKYSYATALIVTTVHATASFALTRPEIASEGFRRLCAIGRMANQDNASGKNEIRVAIQKSTGYSKAVSEKVTQNIIDDFCPGVW